MHNHFQRLRSKKFLALFVLAALAGGALWALTAGPWAPDDYTPPRTASQYTKGETADSKSDDEEANNPGSRFSDKNTNTAGAVTLLVPSGNFVSNHRPNLSGVPAPNTMESVCNTTPGARCKISFTKDGVTKSLPEQTTDSGGATYWSWKLQDVGLTEGSWKIQAIATLNGQSKDASDALDLVVSQ